MNRLLASLTVLTIVLLYPAAGIAPAQEVTLRQDWAPGNYVMTIDNQVNQTTTMGRQSAGTATTSRLVLEITARDLADGRRALTIQVREVGLSLQAPLIQMKYDSTDPTQHNPMLKAQLEPLLNTPIEVILSAAGEVAEVRGVEPLRANLDPEGPGAAVVNDMFSTQSLQQMLIPPWLPAGPVSVAQGWPSAIEAPMPGLGTGKVELTNTLAEIRDEPPGRVAEVKSQGTFDVVGDEAQGAPSGKYDVKVEYLHDLGRNLMRQSKVHRKGQLKAAQGQDPRIKHEVLTLQSLTVGKYKPSATSQPAAMAPAPEDPQQGGRR